MVGSDSRAGLTPEQRKQLGTGNAAGQRTDTIMLLHTGSGPNLLMSIPRDLAGRHPGARHHEDQRRLRLRVSPEGGADGGAKPWCGTIEQNTGIRIDDYVEIGPRRAGRVVDAVGGIEICPTTAMKDKLANLDIEKGCQEVDGTTASATPGPGTRRGSATSTGPSTSGGGGGGRRQGHVAVDVRQPGALLAPEHGGAGLLRLRRGTGPFQAAKWAMAMTRVGPAAWCRSPTRRALGPGPLPSRCSTTPQDKTDDIPKALCTPTGPPEEHHRMTAGSTGWETPTGGSTATARRHAHAQPARPASNAFDLNDGR